MYLVDHYVDMDRGVSIVQISCITGYRTAQGVCRVYGECNAEWDIVH